MARPQGTPTLVPLTTPIFQDDLVDNLPARNTPPSEKMLTDAVKLLKNHHAPTSMTSHMTTSSTVFSFPVSIIFAKKGGGINGVNPVDVGYKCSILGPPHCVEG